LSPHSSYSRGNCLDIQLRRFGIVFTQNIRIADTSKNTQNISCSEKKLASSPACLGICGVMLLRGLEPHLHPRTESSGVVWGGPSPPALARGVGFLEGLVMAQTARCWLEQVMAQTVRCWLEQVA
jgi:hypothetical protein